MPAYHQMGHDSENLLAASGLERLAGAILSPVNYNQEEMIGQISELRQRANFETIFDPQLYVPQSERGCLSKWDYFPKDVDTSDPSNENWWVPITENLGKLATELQPSALCSPAVVPRTYPNDYFDLLTKITKRLSERLRGTSQVIIQTVIANLSDLATPGRALTIASILSRSPVERFFIVLVGNTEPRRELADPEELKGAMRLINALTEAGLIVTVGFSSSEMILWKAAGAHSCATGSFLIFGGLQLLVG